MPKKLLLIFFIILVFVLGCSSNNITGEAVSTEPDIFEDAPAIEQQAENQTIEETIEGNHTDEQVIQIKTGE